MALYDTIFKNIDYIKKIMKINNIKDNEDKNHMNYKIFEKKLF